MQYTPINVFQRWATESRMAILQKKVGDLPDAWGN